MKVAILTSQERVEKFTDWSLVPKDTELIYIGQTYTDDEVIQKAKDADAILVDAVNVVSGNIIRNLPNLKLVQSEGVAYNLIDTEAAKEQGIYVCNNASANAGSVAEHTIMLMLACTRRLIEGDTLVRRGKQIQAKGSFILAGIPELEHCHVGLLGFGAIAKQTAKRLKGFGCRVSYYSRHQVSEEIEQEYQVSYLPLQELYRSCDILSIHVPVTAETKNMGINVCLNV